MSTVSAGIGCGRVIVQVSGSPTPGVVGAGLAVSVTAGGGVVVGAAVVSAGEGDAPEFDEPPVQATLPSERARTRSEGSKSKRRMGPV